MKIGKVLRKTSCASESAFEINTQNRKVESKKVFGILLSNLSIFTKTRREKSCAYFAI